MNRWLARLSWCMVLIVLSVPCHLLGAESHADREGQQSTETVLDELPVTVGFWQCNEARCPDDFCCPSPPSRLGEVGNLAPEAFRFAAPIDASRSADHSTLLWMGSRLDI